MLSSDWETRAIEFWTVIWAIIRKAETRTETERGDNYVPYNSIENFQGARDEFFQHLYSNPCVKKTKFVIMFGTSSQVDNRMVVLECEKIDAHLD